MFTNERVKFVSKKQKHTGATEHAQTMPRNALHLVDAGQFCYASPISLFRHQSSANQFAVPLTLTHNDQYFVDCNGSVHELYFNLL